MARKPSAKVTLHRSKFAELTLGVADGLFAAAQDIILDAATHAPDSPYDPYPEGEGLPKQGGVLAFVGGGKTAGWSIRGVQPRKPRALRTPAKENAVLVAGGFGFPARFAEGGTVNHPAQPFLTPALHRGEPRILPKVREVLAPILRRP